MCHDFPNDQRFKTYVNRKYEWVSWVIGEYCYLPLDNIDIHTIETLWKVVKLESGRQDNPHTSYLDTNTRDNLYTLWIKSS